MHLGAFFVPAFLKMPLGGMKVNGMGLPLSCHSLHAIAIKFQSFGIG